MIRVRVIDSAFEGRSRGRRFDRLEPALAGLPEEIERDVIGVYPLTPAEAECTADGPHPRAAAMNWEFEHPDPSDDW